MANEKVRLHRLTSQIIRRDSGGEWRLRLNLMAPEVVEETKEEKQSVAVPPSAGSAKESHDETIRGGWQLILAREFYF